MNLLVKWLFLHIVPATIMLQTLFYKFSGAEESKYIFSVIGMEPWGRYSVGFAELIAGILLLIPNLSWLGALMGIGLMTGAIFVHLFFLGIEVQNDGGMLFALAVIVFITSLLNVFIQRARIISVVQTFKNKK